MARVCPGCGEDAFLRGPRGEIVGGSPRAARRWLHDALTALRDAGRARATLTRSTSAMKAIDRELSNAWRNVEAFVADLTELESVLDEAGLDPENAQVIQ